MIHILRTAARLVALPALAAASALGAQSPTAAPVGFRGGFTEPSGTIAAGDLQFDVGTAYTRAGEVRQYSVGEFTARAGVASRLELRLHLNSFVWSDTPAGRSTGREDVSVGAAAALSSNRGLRPAAALIANLAAPSGSTTMREDTWRPTGKLSMSWAVPARATLATMVAYSRASAAGERFDVGMGSVWLGRPVAKTVTAFAETYAFTRQAPGGDATAHVRGGVAVLVASSLHVDVHAGARYLGEGTASRTVGLGLRTRW
jgi:hypothetical protein